MTTASIPDNRPKGVLDAELQRAYDALIAIDYPDPDARDEALRRLGIAAKRWMEAR